MNACDDIVVGRFPKQREQALIVRPDAHLSETTVALGVFGEVVLVGAVVIGLESQFDGLFVRNIAFQWGHLHDVGEALQKYGSEHGKDADELYKEVWFLFHGLESKVDEGVEIGNAQRAC